MFFDLCSLRRYLMDVPFRDGRDQGFRMPKDTGLDVGISDPLCAVKSDRSRFRQVAPFLDQSLAVDLHQVPRTVAWSVAWLPDRAVPSGGRRLEKQSNS